MTPTSESFLPGTMSTTVAAAQLKSLLVSMFLSLRNTIHHAGSVVKDVLNKADVKIASSSKRDGCDYATVTAGMFFGLPLKNGC